MVPKLRFKGFHSQWFSSLLGDIGTFKNGLNKDKSEFGYGVPFVNLMDVFGKLEINDSNNLSLVNANKKEIKDYSLLNGDVLFIRSSVKPTGVGETAVVTQDLENTVFSGFLIRYRNKSLLTSYKKYYFWHPGFRARLLSLSTTSANTNINQDSLSSLEINIPCEAEQKRIADFLSSVDEKITLLNKQYDLLCQYKKGIMQTIFSQELRFKDHRGEEFLKWEAVELKKIASKVNTKNRDNLVTTVLTNSATQGIVSQESYFEREIVTESNLTGYYVVRIGDFVYNPRISSTAPVGPIKMNELIQGVMSPLYTVFRFEKGLLKFYQYFFESSVWHDYMKSVANSGARHDRMNISGADFFGLPVPQPSEEEQTKIAKFLSAIDDKITTKKAELDKLKIWKQGLLQQMFV